MTPFDVSTSNGSEVVKSKVLFSTRDCVELVLRVVEVIVEKVSSYVRVC